MKLQRANPDGQNIFTAYGDDYVSINAVRHQRNVLVQPDDILADWTSASFERLSLADIEKLAALDAEIIILGTGKQIRFPKPELLQPLMQHQKGLEVMDIQAACRTYNVLVGEGRKVAAALLFD